MCQEALDLERSNEEGLRVNAGKTKIMICSTGLDLLQSSGKFPCTICCTGVGSNSIFCNVCKHWVHKKCSGLKGMTKDPDYRCTRCWGTARPLDGRPQKTRLDLTSLRFVCIEVLRPSQPNGVMSSAVSLPNHTFTGQA